MMRRTAIVLRVMGHRRHRHPGHPFRTYPRLTAMYYTPNPSSKDHHMEKQHGGNCPKAAPAQNNGKGHIV
jgi:hypothetical protein